MQTKKAPHFPLDRVKELASTRNGLFLQRTRARDVLVGRTGSVAAAYKMAREMILCLTLENFAETLRLTVDIADVYGMYRQGEGWYLKLTVDETRPEVAVISLHPLEHPLATRGGLVKPYESKG